ncbi:BRCA1-associated RING domain protein 1 [Lissotriton helveticus]
MAPPLGVRSGNRVTSHSRRQKDMSIGLENNPQSARRDWVHTRAALELLEKRLLCSLCDGMLEEPVCLGGCEHVFCRKCVGSSIGSECPVCQTPAWVKDVQINRQLANMIQLCSKLHNVLDGSHKLDEKKKVFTSMKANMSKADTKKKQIRMWFSPRSGKVKCVLDKPLNLEQPLDSGGAIYQAACSTFAFVPSPPNKGTAKKQKKASTKPTKSKKRRLDVINQQWGFGKKQPRGGSGKWSNEDAIQPQEERTVSFCSQPIILCSPEPCPVEEAPLELGLVTEPGPSQNGSVCHVQLSIQVNPLENTAENEDIPPVDSPSPESKPKRGRKLSVSFSTPSPASKRPQRVKPSVGFGNVGDSPEPSQMCSPERVSLTNNHITIAQISSAVAESPKPVKYQLSGDEKGACSPHKSPIATPSTPSSCTRKHAETSFLSPCRQSAKRNYKGETLLHITSIKGDLLAVEDLLKNGGDPNVKDHAGWTPLHEACNHGHVAVVELLLQHRALVNTTGYQNDSPLHDAVKNGHTAIVKLLLAHGASREAVNIFGLRPVDYAETEEMKSVLLLQSRNNEESLSAGQGPAPVILSQQREGPVVLMGSGLSFAQQKVLSKLGGVLKAGRCTEFNNTVTHVIVPDEGVVSTMKGMLGILAGCWIVRFQWVQACLESRLRELEEPYEVPGGPIRGRLNKEHLLPNLLDGCYFFFLGWFKTHCKEDLMELVKAAGGQVLARQPKPDSDVTQTVNTVAYHAEATSDQSFCTQYIIYDKSTNYCPTRVRQGKVWTAPSSWLVDCITSFQLLPVPSDNV